MKKYKVILEKIAPDFERKLNELAENGWILFTSYVVERASARDPYTNMDYFCAILEKDFEV